MKQRALAVALVAAGTLCAAGAGWAAETKDQQKCINKTNRGAQKLHEAQANENRSCVKDAGRGDLPGTAEACLTADLKGKVAKRIGKNVASDDKFCTPAGVTPDFGYTSVAIANTAAQQTEIALMHDLFGNPIDGGLFLCDGATDECLCQRNMINRIEEVASVIFRVFKACKKPALKEDKLPFLNGAASAAELQTCFDDVGTPQSVAADVGAQIADVVGLFNGALTEWCETPGVTGVAFPGPACATLTGVNARDCLEALVRCRVCLMTNSIDGLSVDCDDFDDALANGSCPP